MRRRACVLPGLRCAAAAGAIAVALLGGCGSTQPTRYHTLMPPPAVAAPTLAPVGRVVWEVLPVVIPAQVDQPQWVVRTVDGSLAMLEQERWIAPLAEEIRAAVAERLTQVVGAAAPAASAESGKRWRVRIDVQRFDSVPGHEARLDASWTLRSDAESAGSLSCRGEFVQTVDSGSYLALAKAHRQGVTQLADAIGRSLKMLSAGQPATCEG